MGLFTTSKRLEEEETIESQGAYASVEMTLSISDFEHSWKVTIMETSASLLHKAPKQMEDQHEMTLEFRANDFALIAYNSESTKDQDVVRRPFTSISKLVWDHEMSAVRFEFKPLSFSGVASFSKDDKAAGGAGAHTHTQGAAAAATPPVADFFTCSLPLSLEVEADIKLRLAAEAKRLETVGSAYSPPETVYLGIFAGPTKPKPFQRKRPNLSATVALGKLPSLKVMHEMAMKAYAGSCSPVPFGTSRRPHLALDLVFLGKVTFPFQDGEQDFAKYGSAGDLQLTYSDMTIVYGGYENTRLTVLWEDIPEWDILNRAHLKESSGLRLTFAKAVRKGNSHDMGKVAEHKGVLQLQSNHLSHVMHSMEFFWNRSRFERNLEPKLGSTHGREVEVVVTVNGEESAPPSPVIGTPVITDVITGNPVKSGQMLMSPNRRHSGSGMSPTRVKKGALSPSAMAASSPLSPSRMSPGRFMGKAKGPLMSNPVVEENWEKVVLYAGWLLKRGGNMKKWLWRYFVLYATAQGHWLAYYSDLPDVPVFCPGNGSATSRKERKMIDLCRVAYIRPVSNQQGAPPNAFDVVTIERSWTLCAETPVLMQSWLRALTRGVNEDAAVYDDEAHRFIMGLCRSDGSGRPDALGGEHHSVLSLSAMGAMLYEGPLLSKEGGPPSEFNVRSEGRYICYTEFYRWSLCRVNGQDVGLSVKIFTDQTFKQKEELLFITSQSRNLAATIEHYIEKFMTIMHMKNEIIMHNDAAAKGPETAEEKAKIAKEKEEEAQSKKQLEATDEFDFSTLNQQPFIRRASLRKQHTDGNGTGDAPLIDFDMGATFELDPGFEAVQEQHDDDDDDFVSAESTPSNSRSLAYHFEDGTPASSPANMNGGSGGVSGGFSGYATGPLTPPPPPPRVGALRIDPTSQMDSVPTFPSSPMVPAIAPYQQKTQQQFQSPYNTAPGIPINNNNINSNLLTPTSKAFQSYFPPTPSQPTQQPQLPLTPTSFATNNPFDDFSSSMAAALPPLPSEKVLTEIDGVIRVSLLSRNPVGYGCSLTLSLTAIGGRDVSAITASAALEGPPVTSLSVISIEPNSLGTVMLQANKSTSLELRVKLLRPYAEAPALRLSFSCGGMVHTGSIPLPLQLDAFVDGLPLTYDKYQAQWKNMVQVSQCQFSCRKVDPNVVADTLRSLRISPIQGIPAAVPGVHMTPAATLLKTGTPSASGELINVGVLVLVETSAAAMVHRLTVRSVNNVVTEALMQTVQEALTSA